MNGRIVYKLHNKLVISEHGADRIDLIMPMTSVFILN